MIQFIKFSIIGASNTLISLTVYYIFIFINNSTHMAMAGQAAGWAISIFTGFLLNKKFTFKDSTELWWKALIKMYVGYTFSLVVVLVLTYIQLEVIGIHAAIVPIVNLAVTVPLNFFIAKYWSFKNGGARNENPTK